MKALSFRNSGTQSQTSEELLASAFVGMARRPSPKSQLIVLLTVAHEIHPCAVVNTQSTNFVIPDFLGVPSVSIRKAAGFGGRPVKARCAA
jgi:hypothetical protein